MDAPYVQCGDEVHTVKNCANELFGKQKVHLRQSSLKIDHSGMGTFVLVDRIVSSPFIPYYLHTASPGLDPIVFLKSWGPSGFSIPPESPGYKHCI